MQKNNPEASLDPEKLSLKSTNTREVMMERKNSERRRLNFLFVAGAMLATPPYIFAYWKLGSPGASLAIIAFSPVILLALFIRRSLSPQAAANCVLGAGFLMFTASSYFTGGLEGPSLYWSVAIPVVGVILCGEGSGFFWLVAVLVKISAFYWVEKFGYQFIQQYPDHIALQTANYITMMGIAGFAFFVAAVSERFKNAYLAEIEDKNQALAEALESIKTLKGLIPICAWCKKIRNDKGYWDKLETFISHNSEAKFSHGMCPECAALEIKRIHEEPHSGEQAP